MGARGRKSAASGELVAVSAVQVMARPDAPYDLTDEQADEWRSVVDRLPADWFPRETWPILTQYCRHVVTARRVAQLIDAEMKSPEFDVGRYSDLLKMAQRESQVIASLATKMRLSQQATYDKSKKKPTAAKRPWES
jgi:hypothetical protein